MARFVADLGFYLSDINLAAMVELASDVQFFNDENINIEGQVYTDVLDVYWYEDTFLTYFAGPNIRYNNNTGEVTGGTITAIFEDFLFEGNYVPAWSLKGVEISAAALWDAGQTASQADDMALIAKALSGADKFLMSDFDDIIRGFGGNDVLKGFAGKDQLSGDAGKDTFFGGAGADKLHGGAGQDTLRGEGGADDFIYKHTSESGSGATARDIIIGFAKGSDDIVVEAIDAKTNAAGKQDFVLDAGGSFSAGEVRQKVVSSGLLLEFNTDGDSAVEMAILLKDLTSRLAKTDFDFEL